MLTIQPRPQKTRWQTVELSPGVSLDVELTPPTFAELLAERVAVTTAEAALLRLNCITNWRGVVEPVDGGEPRAVPFTRDHLGSLLQQYAPALNELLSVIRPLFSPVTDDREKKFAAPPAAAIPPNPSSNDSSISADSPPLPPSSV